MLIAKLALLVACLFAAEDVVVLKDGTELHGKIVIRTAKAVHIQLEESGELRKVARGEIARIDEGEPEAAEPEAAADAARARRAARERAARALFAEGAYEKCTQCGGGGCVRCTACGGDWERCERAVACEQCDGEGKVVCIRCHGTGGERCLVCRGKGKVYKRVGTERGNGRKRNVMRWVACDGCGGKGKVQCTYCEAVLDGGRDGRSGAVRVGGRGAKPRKPGRDSGPPPRTLTCRRCKGKGTKVGFGVCPDCEVGWVRCPRCAVRGSLREAAAPEVGPLFDAVKRVALRSSRPLDQTETEALFSAASAVSRVSLWLEANEGHRDAEWYRLLQKHRMRVGRVFTELTSNSRSPIAWSQAHLPVDFARDDAGRSVFMVSASVLPTDELRWVPSSVVSGQNVRRDVLVGCFYQLARAMRGSGFERYGIVATYPVKTEAGLSVRGTFPEVLAVVVDAVACEQLVAGRLTREALLRGADCYMNDLNQRDASVLIKTELPW